MTYLIGFIAIAVGVFMIVKTEWLVEKITAAAPGLKRISGQGGRGCSINSSVSRRSLSVMGMTGLLGKSHRHIRTAVRISP